MTRERANTALFRVCRTGDVDAVRLLLDAGADVNAKDKSGCTPLHRACDHGRTEIVQLLLEKGADVNVKDKYSNTPLLNVFNYDSEAEADADIVRLLLDHGADVNVGDKSNVTPLHWACRKRQTDIVQSLLDHGADVNAKVRGDGDTPLHYACFFSHIDGARLLLDHGADVEAKSGSWTPLGLVLDMLPGEPAREGLIDLFREYAPEHCFTAFCETPAPGRR